jgi:hypothetical protein
LAQDPTLMFCVGATKAGTSWLYRYLHDHPECHLRSIKELHFFDTIDFDDYERQFDVFARLRADLAGRLASVEAKAASEGKPYTWQLKNLRRQIRDIDEMVAALEDPQLGELLYETYLFRGIGESKLIGDLTPAYALLSKERFAKMAEMAENVRFVFLMRDPIDRLWSHVRMQANRNLQPGEDVTTKSKNIVGRMATHGDEPHILERGDYADTITRLRAAVPAERLLLEFTEELFSEAGVRRLCEFLGISYVPAKVEERWHVGPRLEMNDKIRGMAADMLAPQYAFAEQNFGQLPERWQENMARV